MPAPRFGWLVCGTLALAGGVGLGLRWQTIHQLGVEVRLKRDDAAELARLRRTRDELKREEMPAAELESLRSDREAVQRLRVEIETLKAKTEKALMPPPATTPPPPKESEILAAKAWANVGRATPRAVVQTALWAALNGDVTALAESIAFENPAVRDQAMRILLAAPPKMQAEYSTPEKLVALLSAKDMPTEGAMKIVDEKIWNDDEISVATILFAEVPSPANPTPKAKIVLLKTRRETGGDWKLTIPAPAVDKYGATLNVPPPPKAR